MDWQHWHLDIEDRTGAVDPCGVDKSVNVLTREVLDELAAVVAVLEYDKRISGLVLRSASPALSMVPISTNLLIC